jgi:hypothetical protein
MSLKYGRVVPFLWQYSPLMIESTNEFREAYDRSDLEVAGIVFNMVNHSKELTHSKRKSNNSLLPMDGFVLMLFGIHTPILLTKAPAKRANSSVVLARV